MSVSRTLAERLLWPWATERSARPQSGILSWASHRSASLTCSGPSPIWQKKKRPEPGPNGLSVSGPVGSRRTCRALQCWSSEPGRLLLKQKVLQGRDIQVVKPYKCGCRGPAGRLTNVWNGHHAVPCPGRGDAPCEMGSDSDGALQPKEEYANVIASTNHLDILCFVTGPPLMQLPKSAIKNMFWLSVRGRTLNAYFQALIPGCPSGGGSTESDMTWVHNPALVSGRPRSR